MLVLTRKAGEEIVIAGHIRVRIGHIRCGRVELVVDAPREVPVHRLETAERIKRSSAEADLAVAATR